MPIRRIKGAQRLKHDLDMGFSFWDSGGPQLSGDNPPQLQRQAPAENRGAGPPRLSRGLELRAQGAIPRGVSCAAGDPSPNHGLRPLTLTVTLARDAERSRL
jgi:hypothetical protein